MRSTYDFCNYSNFLGGFCKLIPEDIYQNHQLTFWMEALAVESFGFSWLIKGETLFKDKKIINT